MVSPITFGPTMADPRCDDCSEFKEGWYCTMNCGPAVKREEEPMAAEMKDVTPKNRVRVQAGREGGPRAAFAEPARLAPTNLPVPAGPEPTNFLAVIARAAADPRCDVAKMQSLLDMQRQIEDRDSVKAFTRDFIALQKVLPVINRDGKIEIRKKDSSGERTGAVQQATPYATYPAIMRVCKPLLDAHGFTLASWIEPELGGARIMVVSQLDHVEHHHRASRFPLPAETSGSKNNVQGWGSSQQYGMRYNAIALLNIVSEAPQDRDHDGHAGNFKPAKGGGFAEVPEDKPKISDDQAMKMRDLIEWCGVQQGKFFEHYGITKVGDLPANLFDAAVKACEDFHANKQAKARHG
jgi:ERF superfamily